MSYESIKKSEHTKLGEAIHRLFEAYLKRHDISMEDLSKLKGPTPIHIDPQGNRELAKPTRVSDQRPARAHAVEDELEKPDVRRRRPVRRIGLLHRSSRLPVYRVPGALARRGFSSVRPST